MFHVAFDWLALTCCAWKTTNSQFRQVGSFTPGHPERFMTDGVQVVCRRRSQQERCKIQSAAFRLEAKPAITVHQKWLCNHEICSGLLTSLAWAQHWLQEPKTRSGCHVLSPTVIAKKACLYPLHKQYPTGHQNYLTYYHMLMVHE